MLLSPSAKKKKKKDSGTIAAYIKEVLKKSGKTQVNDNKPRVSGSLWEIGQDPPSSFIPMKLILFIFFSAPSLSFFLLVWW